MLAVAVAVEGDDTRRMQSAYRRMFDNREQRTKKSQSEEDDTLCCKYTPNSGVGGIVSRS